MPVAAPSRNTPSLVKQPLRFVVLLGPEDGSPPTLDDEVDYLEVQSISQAAGGSRQYSIKLRWNFAKLDQHIEDTTAPVNYGRQVEVRYLDENDEPTLLAAWGFITAPTMRIGDTEAMDLLVRIEPWHFGNTLRDHRYCREPVDPDDPEEEPVFLSVQRPCVVNPEIDGVIIGNRSLKREPLPAEEEEGLGEDEQAALEAERPYVFLDPDQVQTTSAQALQQHIGEPPKWTPSQIVHAICWTVNPDETHVKNPTLAELREAFGAPAEEDAVDDDSESNLDTTEQLKNVTLEYGKYLPDLLDTLLWPLGVGWYLDFALADPAAEAGEEPDVDNLERETRIRFYRRGYGDLVKLRMQRFGQPLDLKQTDLPAGTIEINLAELANVVHVRGSRKRYETTLWLMPGWREDDDDVKIAKTEYDPETIQAKPYVARKYVLNEAGDYRPPYRENADSHYRRFEFIRDDLQLLLGEELLTIRRRFHPCLTTKQPPDELDGEPAEEQRSIGYWLEVWDRNYIQPEDVLNDLPAVPAATPFVKDDVGWRRVRSSFSVLDHECGILFEKPQMQLWRLHQEIANPPNVWDPEHEDYDEDQVPDYPGLYLRITACLDADEHLEHRATRRASSPNAQDVELFLDVPDKFHFREVDTTSIFWFQPGDTDAAGNPIDFAADEQDDTDKLEAYANKIRSVEDAALVSCSLTLPGCDNADLGFGKLIDKLDGRNISLNGNAPADVDVEPRRLQIVGWNITLNPEQKTELLLESFKEERA